MTKIIVQNPTRPSLLLSPDGSRDRNGPITPTLTGGVRVVPSDRNEWVETEGTTNLIMNPSAEISSNWWNAVGSGVEIERITTDSVFGDSAVKIVSADTGLRGWLVRTSGVTAPAGTVFTGSIYVKFPADIPIRILLREGAGGALTAINSISTGEWQRLSVTHTLAVDNPDYLHIRVDNGGTGGGSYTYTAYADGAQIEKKAHATPYADGSLGEGHAWTGTPHSSASTRQYSKVAVGKQINAWQVAEATTNLVMNPRGDTIVQPWTASHPLNWAKSQDTTMTKDGVPSIKVENIGPSYILTMYSWPMSNTEILEGDVLTVSGWIRCDMAGSSWRVRLHGTTGYVEGEQQDVSPSANEWTYFSFTTPPMPTGVGNVRMYVYHTTGNPLGLTMWLCQPQVEKKPYATPYADGELGAGHAWTGAPHASESTRTEARVTLNAPATWLSGDRGAVLMRYLRSTDDEPASQVPYHLSIGDRQATTTSSYFGFREQGTTIRLRDPSGTAGRSESQSPKPTQDIWVTSYIEWTPETQAVDFGTGEGLKTMSRGGAVNPFLSNLVIGGLQVAGYPANGKYESALFFDTPLTEAERQRLTTMDEAWTWQNASLTERMVDAEIEIAVPKGKSGLNIIETKVYESNMFGATGREIPVTNAKMTSDIDRAGSKTRVDLETVSLDPAYKYSIGPGQWVSVFQEIARENEGIERVQRGVFELGQPTVRSKGQRDNVHNSGSDVVDRLARASVLDTFYTPPRGFVMNDIHLAIRMLGITSMGPNLVQNGSFEDGTTGWSFEGVASGSSDLDTHSGAGGPVDGGMTISMKMVSGTEYPQFRAVRQTSMNLVPAGAKKVLLSAWVYNFEDRYFESMIEIKFNGTPTGDVFLGTGWHHTENGWQRIYAVLDVPESWTGLTMVGISRVRNGIGAIPSTSRTNWDDIQVREITGDLLPESVLALPDNSTRASNRIQHLPGDTLLAAVNDRLASIGMMAVHATPDGKFTSRQARDTATDATVRTFHLNEDMRMIGDVTVERSVTSMYNRVFAIKEDFTTGEAMIAIAENDNVSDPWSIHNILLEPKIVTSQDAADLQVLQDLADVELARASVQVSIKFGILPDPALTVYDMIYIEGPPGHRVVGRWAIESIESGLTTDNPLMIIGARRSTR